MLDGNSKTFASQFRFLEEKLGPFLSGILVAGLEPRVPDVWGLDGGIGKNWGENTPPILNVPLPNQRID